MKVSIIGSGRVGLSLGAVLANSGFSVLMTDKEDKKRDILGQPSFYEAQLSEYLEKNKDNLEWTRRPEKISSSKIIFFCLGFPIKKEGDLDLTELFGWCRHIAEHSKENKILVVKSTVPIGTNQKIQDIIGNKKIAVVSCPEFLREGRAIRDLTHPQRVIIGSRDKKAVESLEELYKKFSKTQQIIHTDPETAELAKLACNAFLGMKISFINEMAGLCEKVQADIEKLKLILGSDSRIGKDFLNSGLGYGGCCLPKDIQMLISQGRKNNQDMELLTSAQKINSALVDHFYQVIKKRCKNLHNIEIAFWGISFKKETDNLTNSPALKLICRLLKAGVRLNIYDPLFVKEKVFEIFKGSAYPQKKNVIRRAFSKFYPLKDDLSYLREKIFEGRCYFHKKALDSLNKGQALIIGSDWEEFRQIPLEQIKQKLSQAFIVDGRSLFLAKDLKQQKFSFYKRGGLFMEDTHSENQHKARLGAHPDLS